MIWEWAYWLKRTPWDTGVTPPELLELVAARFHGGGRAIDVGCGTGANVVFLARSGFATLGIDVSRRAIALARRRLREAAVLAEVKVGSATRLRQLAGQQSFDLALDIGCFHVLSPSDRRAYADGLRQCVVKRGVYLLYAFLPRESSRRVRGASPDEIGSLFADGFLLENMKQGEDGGSGYASAWYTLRRV